MIFWGVVTFSILVFVHEGGHFLAARAFRLNVHEFMLGLPGPALRFKGKSGTSFGVTAIPLGGYVRIAGMEPGAEDPLLALALKKMAEAGRIDSSRLSQELGVPVEKASSLLVTLADYMAIEPASDDDISYDSLVTTTPDESADQLLARVRSKTYRGLRTWKRVTVLAAGVAVNIVAAILVFVVVLTGWGIATATTRIDTVVRGSGAAAAGLRAGDRLTAVDGKKFTDWDQLLARLQKSKAGDAVTITFVRGGETRTVTARLTNQAGHGFLGVGPVTFNKRLSVPAAFVQALAFTGAVFAAVWQFVSSIVHPRQFVESLQGARSVVGIAQLASEQAAAGALDYAWFVAFLSLSLGAMNILPIPPLDGGKVLIEGVERAAGHPLKREVSLAISATGTLLLFTLIGYLMYADIARIAVGH
jgi:regulator of sigma E protease